MEGASCDARHYTHASPDRREALLTPRLAPRTGSTAHQPVGTETAAMLAAVLGRARVDLTAEVPTERFLRTKAGLFCNPLQRSVSGFQQLARESHAFADQPVDRRQAGGVQELPLQRALAGRGLLGGAAQ